VPDRTERTRAGVLRPREARQHIDLGHAAPPAALAEYVDYLWWVTWQATTPYRSAVIPRPVVHISAEPHGGLPRLLVHGVHSRHFVRELSGTGRTVAVAFRPGCFRPFLRAAVTTLRDRELPLADVLGVDDRPLARLLLDPAIAVEAAAGELADWLVRLDHTPDPRATELAALVEHAESSPEVVRAEQLAGLAGVSLRTLQRQFLAYVGIGPKWVVQRCRLLDVASAANAGEAVDWARLATDLGYADQSHLVRAFTGFVGQPPAAYAAEQQSRPLP